MANHAARRAPGLKLTAEGRRSHNLSIAKRSALLYLTTLCGLLERQHADYEMAPIGLSIIDARSVFGTWNQTFPPHLKLIRLSDTLRSRVIGEGQPTLESITLLGLSKMARIIATAPTPEGATAEVLALHGQTLGEASDLFRSPVEQRWFLSYCSTREKLFEDLNEKLR